MRYSSLPSQPPKPERAPSLVPRRVVTPEEMAEARKAHDRAETKLAFRALLVPAAALVASTYLILKGTFVGRGAFDHMNFHEPAARVFAGDWPRPDFSNYLSATTPLYHVLVALAAKFVATPTSALQFVAHFFTFILLALLTHQCLKTARSGLAMGACIAVAASPYVFDAGVWLLPDNLGWSLVLVMLLLSLRPRVDTWTYLGGSLALLILVCARQNHLWAALPWWAAVWLGTPIERKDPAPAPEAVRYVILSFFLRPFPRMLRMTMVAIATIPAVLAVAYFAKLWGGLTPPFFQEQYTAAGPVPMLSRLNFAAPAFVLAIFGLFSIFFAASLAKPVREMLIERPAAILLLMGLGAALAVIPSTVPNPDLGRSSGLWTLAAQVSPVANHTNPVIAGLAILGAVSVGAWCQRLGRRDGLILVAALAGFALSLTASFHAWQRYVEPLVLILLALCSCRLPGGPFGSLPKNEIWHRYSNETESTGPVVLAMLLGSITAWTIYRGEPQTRLTREELVKFIAPNAPPEAVPRFFEWETKNPTPP